MYDGVRLVAALADEGSLRADLVGPAAARTAGRAGATNGRVHLARAEGLGFDVVA